MELMLLLLAFSFTEIIGAGVPTLHGEKDLNAAVSDNNFVAVVWRSDPQKRDAGVDASLQRIEDRLADYEVVLAQVKSTRPDSVN